GERQAVAGDGAGGALLSLDWGQKVAVFVRENPGTALLGALAVGFVVGKMASRR
ncbi:MAG: hypothetical protein FJ086_15875, partial [Deltaproteobacteria bacterium]|nr:hypothetical protein [Deltaproteobacteria bacterium]